MAVRCGVTIERNRNDESRMQVVGSLSGDSQSWAGSREEWDQGGGAEGPIEAGKAAVERKTGMGQQWQLQGRWRLPGRCGDPIKMMWLVELQPHPEDALHSVTGTWAVTPPVLNAFRHLETRKRGAARGDRALPVTSCPLPHATSAHRAAQRAGGTAVQPRSWGLGARCRHKAKKGPGGAKAVLGEE